MSVGYFWGDLGLFCDNPPTILELRRALFDFAYQRSAVVSGSLLRGYTALYSGSLLGDYTALFLFFAGDLGLFSDFELV